MSLDFGPNVGTKDRKEKGDLEFLAWEKLVGGDVKMMKFGFGCVCV